MWTNFGPLITYKGPVLSLFDEVDERLRDSLKAEYEERRGAPIEALPRGVMVVLAGHRAAGKTRLLPHVARLLGRQGVDLDAELERRSGRALKDWVKDDEPGFRAAERELFDRLESNLVVAVGGGFLAKHSDALFGKLVVLVPVTFATYAERLRADPSRPRLMPSLGLEEELRQVYTEREALHRAARPTPLVDFVLMAERGLRPRRVVTLPPDGAAEAFAWNARHKGAELLEIRTDLVPHHTDLRRAARALPLIVSQRTDEVPAQWLELAALVDRPLERGGGGTLVSFHAEKPLSTDEVLALWESVPPGCFVKHIEPLGSLGSAPRLFETRAKLVARFGASLVTVLPMGPLALPFRAVLAQGNALDFVAMEGGWTAAPGQRLLVDALRESRRAMRDPERARLGILGHRIAHSRSPRIHQAPFDRIDLDPAAVDLEALLAALMPHYSGFAVTNPFKKVAARAVASDRDAVNTLVRRDGKWASFNSDVEGARAVLEALGDGPVTVLGEGGVADALGEAARGHWPLTFIKRSQVPSAPVTGLAVWTWPVQLEPPPGLRFEGARVAVIAYGAAGLAVARKVTALGGTPVRLGPRWFIAQARRQRQLWESAT